MPISSGDLKNRLIFAARLATAPDDLGNERNTFTDQFTRWAAVAPRLGGETVTAARLEGRSIATLTVRYDSDTLLITTDWRATDEQTGEVWNIKSPAIDPYSTKEFLQMLAEKGGPV